MKRELERRKKLGVLFIILMIIYILLYGYSIAKAEEWNNPMQVNGSAPEWTSEIKIFCEGELVSETFVYAITHGGWQSPMPPDWVYFDIFEAGCEAGDFVTFTLDGWPVVGGFEFVPGGFEYFDLVKVPVQSTSYFPLILGG